MSHGERSTRTRWIPWQRLDLKRIRRVIYPKRLDSEFCPVSTEELELVLSEGNGMFILGFMEITLPTLQSVNFNEPHPDSVNPLGDGGNSGKR